MQLYTTFQNFALFILRASIAAVFFVAGYDKIPFWSGTHPELSAFMLLLTKILSIAEPLGALALLLGFLTRIAAGGLLIIMLGAIYYLQFVWKFGFRTPTSVGWNFPLVLLAGCLLLIAFGAGSWSIDARRR